MKPLTYGLFAIILISLCPAQTLVAEDKGVVSLANEIQAYQAKQDPKQISPADRAVMQKAARDLAASMPDPGLKVGEQAPDFTLPNAFGRKVKLSESLKDGPVVLSFYRGAWCPYCNLELQALTKTLPQFKQHDAQLIAITPQQPQRSAEQIRKDGYGFEILSDLDDSVTKSYGLYYEVPEKLNAVYLQLGLDLEAFNGKGRHGLPVPGTFVIDRQGVVRSAFANTDYTQRMEPAAILTVLKALSPQ